MKATHSEREHWRTNDTHNSWAELTSGQMTHRILAVLIAVAIGMAAVQIIRDSMTIDEAVNSLSTELFGAAATFYALELVIRPKKQAEDNAARKQQLIRDMGSPVRNETQIAIAALRKEGWLYDGSMQMADLTNANLRRSDLTYSNLQDVAFGNANLKETKLGYANLQGANLIGAQLEAADFELANLTGADLSHAHLEKASFLGTNLFGAKLEGAFLINSNFKGANLERAHLWCAHLNVAMMRGCNLQNASAYGCQMQGVDLFGTNIRGINLGSSDLQHANLAYSDLQGAGLPRSNLSHAQLHHANLEESGLGEANLENADISFANLNRTDGRLANLYGSNLSNISLEGANLELANLREALGIKTAKLDINTILPNGEKWQEGYDVTRFTDPQHVDFWDWETHALKKLQIYPSWYGAKLDANKASNTDDAS